MFKQQNFKVPVFRFYPESPILIPPRPLLAAGTERSKISVYRKESRTVEIKVEVSRTEVEDEGIV